MMIHIIVKIGNVNFDCNNYRKHMCSIVSCSGENIKSKFLEPKFMLTPKQQPQTC